MDRRSFIASASLPFLFSSTSAQAQSLSQTKELKTDIAIIGGGMGGVAAALAALRNGKRVILTEETDWIGGQVTAQGVPPDENPWIEQFGCTASYRDYRNRIRDFYRRNYPLTPEARAIKNLNPGAGSVSRICHEPRVSLAVFYEMLLPYLTSGQLILLLETHAVEAKTEGDAITAVRVEQPSSGLSCWLQAAYFVDSTEMGDLLPLAQVEYVTGAESRDETGEDHAAERAEPANMQSATWCFAIDYMEGENHVVEKPEQYDFWRDYVPQITPAWPGKQLSWTYSHPPTLKPITRYCDPIGESEHKSSGFWLYRRIVHKKYFTPGLYPSDTIIVNWPQNDYLPGNFYEVTPEERDKHLYGAQQLSLSLLYWMQTEAPRPDGKTGYPGMRLRDDIFGTSHGLAKYPYIRESRRIKAEFTIKEQHVGTDMRARITGHPKNDVTAEKFSDSIGVGGYRIDLHPSTGGDNYIDIGSLPFQIPLGALIPIRVKNLLAGCKNLGVTHITNGCYRLHPVEWNIGESAGLIAAYCINASETPSGVRNTPEKLHAFQSWITAQGVEIDWPKTRAL